MTHAYTLSAALQPDRMQDMFQQPLNSPSTACPLSPVVEALATPEQPLNSVSSITCG